MADIAVSPGINHVGLLSIGVYRPERVVTNDEICEKIDSSDEWIVSRTGIKTRRFAAREESAASMAIEAGRRAISNAGLTPADIDAVIVATSTHFVQTPACAPLVASGVGAQGVPGFDVNVGCAGFGYAIAIAADMLRAGSAAKVLVIGSEKLSPTLDMTDRGNCFIFADGAGAVVVGETAEPGIGATVWGSDGTQGEAVRQDLDWIDYTENPTGTRPFLRMEGTAVFRWAAFEMSKVAARALELAKIGPGDLQAFVPHQANVRITELLAKSLLLGPDTVVANDITHTGNTSAASIPLAMEELLSSGASKEGDLALLLGYGAGLSYAAQVVRMPPAPVE